MTWWSTLALASGGLFAAGVSYFTWVRIPRWERMADDAFRSDFARWIKRADRVQPALLFVALAATVGIAFGVGGVPRALALVAALGYLAILGASVAILVPLQRRLVKDPTGDVTPMRDRWSQGHRVRTAFGIASFVLVAAALILDAQG